VNEAASKAKRITHRDMEDAVEKVVAGPERKSRRLSEDEKRRVAYHEVGHALVAAYSKHADPVHKISIIPRGRAALGYTMQLPTGEQFLMSRSELLDRIRGALGGRAAEEEVFHEVTTGAENDLERATTLARQMVCLFGMGEKIGLARCAQHQTPLYLTGPEGTFQRDCSEKTAEQIDEEVRRILDRCYAEAQEILRLHRDQVDLVTAELLKHETLDAEALNRLIGRRTDEQERYPVSKEQTPLKVDA
jgi:cell division protease FtsH